MQKVRTIQENCSYCNTKHWPTVSTFVACRMMEDRVSSFKAALHSSVTFTRQLEHSIAAPMDASSMLSVFNKARNLCTLSSELCQKLREVIPHSLSEIFPRQFVIQRHLLQLHGRFLRHWIYTSLQSTLQTEKKND